MAARPFLLFLKHLLPSRSLQASAKQELKQLEKTIKDKQEELTELRPKYQDALGRQEALEKEYVACLVAFALKIPICESYVSSGVWSFFGIRLVGDMVICVCLCVILVFGWA
jgi:hypothetical protein